MIEYSVFDQAAEQFLPNYEAIRGQVQALNAKYWVYVHDSSLVGELAVGVDPLQVTPPPGTVTALVMVRGRTQSSNVISSFIEKACETAEHNKAQYYNSTEV